MADLDLDELARLEKTATPGPWPLAIIADADTSETVAEYLRKCALKGGEGPGWMLLHPEDAKVREDARITAFTGNGPTSEANARLIAALRNAAPALLAAAREGADRLDLLHECWEQWAYEAQEKGWMFAGGLSTLEGLSETLVKAGRLEEHPKGGMYRAALAGKGGGRG